MSHSRKSTAASAGPSGFRRRAALKLIGGGTLAGALASAGCGGSDSDPPAPPPTTPKTLRILQWNHWVPEHDIWFDNFARTWGEANGVEVTVTHVALGMLGSRVAQELTQGAQFDLMMTLGALAQHEPFVVDLKDVSEAAVAAHGPQVELCRKSTFNPKTGVQFGFSPAWNVIPANFRKSLWAQVDMPNGPTTWQEVLSGGRRLKNERGVPVGLGLANENDSNFTQHSIMYSFGAGLQNASGQIALDSAATRAYLEYVKQLYTDTMTPDVLSWSSAANNERLLTGQTSFIINPLSAYRLAQKNSPALADDVFFTKGLAGPSTPGMFIAHPMSYVVPKSSPNVSAAKDFLLHLVANHSNATYISELFDFPAFLSTVPQLQGAENWLDQDPYLSNPRPKLAFQREAHTWSVMYGHPGTANAAMGEAFSTFLVPQMAAKHATGEMNVDQAIQWAMEKLGPIYDKWRAQGLV